VQLLTGAASCAASGAAAEQAIARINIFNVASFMIQLLRLISGS
jgi:hypothetical protein